MTQSAADMKATQVQTNPKPASHDCPHQTFTAVLVSQAGVWHSTVQML